MVEPAARGRLGQRPRRRKPLSARAGRERQHELALRGGVNLACTGSPAIQVRPGPCARSLGALGALKGVWWWVSFSFVRAAANANSELMATTFRFESCSGTVERANRSGSPQVSQLLIQQYLNEMQKLRRMSGTARESVVREAFKTLLKDWGKSHDLTFIPEYEYQTVQKTRVYPDGALVYELRVVEPPPFAPQFLEAERPNAIDLALDRSGIHRSHG
jgi:hypothetical protein